MRSDTPVAGSAWTDEGLFFVRVDDDANAASLVDPAGGEAPVVPPPFELPLQGGVPEVVTAADEVVVQGVECEAFVEEEGEEHDVCAPGRVSAAAYDLEAGTWRVLDLLDEVSGVGRDGVIQARGVTSDGRIVFDVGTGALPAPGAQPFWTYAPTVDEWVHLADPGVGVEDACVAGDRLVVVSASEDPDGYVDTTLSELDLMDPSAAWTAGEAQPDVAFALTPRLQCADTFAVVAAMLAYDPADANPTSPMAAYRHALGDIAAGGWSRVDGVPEDLIPYNSVAAGNRVLLLDEGDGLVIGQDGPAVALDLPRVPYQPGVRPVWTGEALLVVDFRTGEVTSVDLPA